MTAGGWAQRVGEVEGPVPFERVDLSALPADEQGPAVTARATELQASLDLEAGPLLRAALFDLGPDRSARLLLVIHHLAVDGVSWRILLEDLQAAYAQLAAGRGGAPAPQDHLLPPVGPPPGGARRARRRPWPSSPTGWRRPAPRRLPCRSTSPAPPMLQHPGQRPVGGGDPGADATRALLQDVPAAYRTRINDALLTALAQTFAAWTGERSLLVDLEGHGREAVVEGVDLSRTVGWFTSVFPVRLALPEGAAAGPGADPGDPGADLKAIKEQLRAVPRNGIGYGLLRYLSPAPALEALPAPQVSFNYLGQFDQAAPEDSPFRLASESAGPSAAPAGARSHILEINGSVVEGRLRLEWLYSAALHHRETVEALAQTFLRRLTALIEHCLSPQAGGFTPSDFPLAGLDQETVDALFGADREVEDVYPLTPMQQGLLFHTRLEPRSESYFLQLTWTLRGQLDEEAFRGAWQGLLDRHPILRTAFVWEGLPAPLQVVQRRVALPWERLDWRELPAAEQEARLEEYLAADRARGFDPAPAPPAAPGPDPPRPADLPVRLEHAPPPPGRLVDAAPAGRGLRGLPGPAPGSRRAGPTAPRAAPLPGVRRLAGGPGRGRHGGLLAAHPGRLRGPHAPPRRRRLTRDGHPRGP